MTTDKAQHRIKGLRMEKLIHKDFHDGQLTALLPTRVSPTDFAAYWSDLYHDPREELYLENIGKPLTPNRVRALYLWKNGGKLSKIKGQSVEQNYIQRIKEAETLPLDTPAANFLDAFSDGGAIWRLFWLHCWQPNRYPIYDQHVHRAMTFIEQEKAEELNDCNDKEKISMYLNQFLPFSRKFKSIQPRTVDRALWAYGKFLKTYRINSMPATSKNGV